MKNNINQLSFFKNRVILNVQSQSGGDIGSSVKVTTKDSVFFVKGYSMSSMGGAAESEAEGLQLIASTKCIYVPKVEDVTTNGDREFLILGFIHPGQRRPGYWEDFGKALASLHQMTTKSYGLSNDNFIGRLPQGNTFSDNVFSFIANSRLLPQGKLALDKGLLVLDEIAMIEKLCTKLESLIPNEPPALIHGDLWSGNYLCNRNGKVVIIDPSVSYSHREFDIAMTSLFGRCAPTFYQTYHDSYPLVAGWKDRVDLFQLYYLLVHLNMFGLSYKNQVMEIVRKYL